jgi:hypothetical protein
VDEIHGRMQDMVDMIVVQCDAKTKKAFCGPGTFLSGPSESRPDLQSTTAFPTILLVESASLTMRIRSEMERPDCILASLRCRRDSEQLLQAVPQWSEPMAQSLLLR